MKITNVYAMKIPSGQRIEIVKEGGRRLSGYFIEAQDDPSIPEGSLWYCGQIVESSDPEARPRNVGTLQTLVLDILEIKIG